MTDENWKPKGGPGRDNRGANKLSQEQIDMMAKSANVNLSKLNAENQWQLLSSQFQTMDKRSRSMMSAEYKKAMRQGSFLKMDATQWKEIVGEYKTKQSFNKWNQASDQVWNSLSQKEKSDFFMEEYNNLTREERNRLTTISAEDRQFYKWKTMAKDVDKEKLKKSEKTLNKNDIYRFIFDEWAGQGDKGRRKTKENFQSKMPREVWEKLESQEVSKQEDLKKLAKAEKRKAEKPKDWDKLTDREKEKLQKDRDKLGDGKEQEALKRKNLDKSTDKRVKTTSRPKDWEKLTDQEREEALKEFGKRKVKKSKLLKGQEILSEGEKEKPIEQRKWEQLSESRKGKGGKQKNWQEFGGRKKEKTGKQRDWEILSESEKEEGRMQKDWKSLNERKQRGERKLKAWDNLSEGEKKEARKLKELEKENKTERLKDRVLKERESIGEGGGKSGTKQKEWNLLAEGEGKEGLKQKDSELWKYLKHKEWKEFSNREKREARKEYLDISIKSMEMKKRLGKDTFNRMDGGDIEAMKADTDEKISDLSRSMKKKEWKEMILDYKELTRGAVGDLAEEIKNLSKDEKDRLLYETYRTTKREDRQRFLEFGKELTGKEGWKKQEKLYKKEAMDRNWEKIYEEYRELTKKEFILGENKTLISDEDWRHFQDWQKRKAVKDHYERLDKSARSQLNEKYRIRMVMEELKSLSDTDRAKMLMVEDNRRLYKRWKEMNQERRAQLDKTQQKKVHFEQWLELKSTSANITEYSQMQQQKESFKNRIGNNSFDKVKKDSGKWLAYKASSKPEKAPDFKKKISQTNHNFRKVLRDKNWAQMAHSGDKYYNYRMGVIAMAQKKYEEAAGYFLKEIKSGGTDRRFSVGSNLSEVDYFPYREMGVAHYYLDQYPKAVKALEKSLKYQKSGRAEYYMIKTREAEQGIECIAARKPKLTYRLEEKDSGTTYITGMVKSGFYLSSFSINRIKIPVEDAGTKMSFEFPVDDYDDSNSIIIEAVNLCGMANQVEIPISKDENAPPSILERKAADPSKNLKIMIPHHRTRYNQMNFSDYFIRHLARSLEKNGRFKVEIIDPIAEGYSAKEMTKYSKLCTLAQAVEADILLILVFKIEENSMEIIGRFLDSLTHHQVALEELYQEDVREEIIPAMASKLTQKILRDFSSVEGHIIKSQKGMVAVDLGKNQGITMGRKFLVYKKKTLEYIGELTINKLYPDISGGKTVLISPVVWVDKGDLVISK